MSTTVREQAPRERVEHEPPEWALVVVHHADPTTIGVRRVVLARAAVDLGRECGAFGERSLDDPLVSRRHARIEADAAGRLQLCDLGSANGTWVNGGRAALAELDEGDVVRVGPVLLSVQRAPVTYSISRSSRAPTVAWSTARFADALRRALEARGLLLLRVPCESAWRPYLARAIEEIANTGGARLSIEPERAAGEAWKRDAVRVVRCAEGASLRALVSAQDEIAARASVAIGVIESAGAGAVDGATGERVLRFPSLEERLEDLPLLARALLADASGGEPRALTHSLSLRLLRASWPEDVDGLAAWARAAARRAGAELGPSDEDLRFTGETRRSRRASESLAPPRPRSEPGEAEFVLSSYGAWFAARGEKIVDLRQRYALARVLRALVASREKSPAAAISIDELVDAGWPGEKLLGDSGTNRLYVAVATLRKLGLRELIERREGGYRLAPEANIELAHSEAPPSAGASS